MLVLLPRFVGRGYQYYVVCNWCLSPIVCDDPMAVWDHKTHYHVNVTPWTGLSGTLSCLDRALAYTFPRPQQDDFTPTEEVIHLTRSD